MRRALTFACPDRRLVKARVVASMRDKLALVKIECSIWKGIPLTFSLPGGVEEVVGKSTSLRVTLRMPLEDVTE